MSPARLLALVGLGWLAVTSCLAYIGVFAAIPAPVGIGPVIVALVAAAIALVLVPSPLRDAAQATDLWWLTAAQVWRIVAGLVFVWYGHQALLPATFVERAGYGDIAAGILALAVLAAPTRAGYWAAHAFGAADLLLAVGTGLTLATAEVPGMATIATFPVVLIPLVGVPFSFATHVLAFRHLAAGRRRVAAQ